MNGRDLTLGLVGALAVAGAVRRSRGSADLRPSVLDGPVYAGGDYADLRDLAYALKQTGSARLEEAADTIVSRLPRTVRGPGVVLVPVPSSKGDTTANRRLAEALAARIGATVVDALHGPERQSSRARKKAGLPGLRAQQMPMTLRAQRQVDLAGSVYLVDNVLDTGETLRAAQRALGRPVGAMVLAVTDRTKGSAARDPYAPIRALGYSDTEIQRALTAAGQGPTALQRGDDATQTAGPTRQGAYPGLDFRPPPEVRKEALRGLRLRKENERRGKRVDPKTGAGPGGWWIGVGRAIQLAVLPAMPPRELRRMRDYFRRHTVDTKAAGFGREDKPTPGFVAWLLWGNDEGRDWAREVAGQMDRMDAEREGVRKRGSRALAVRGARLTAELTGRTRKRRGSRNASDPTAGLSEELRILYDTLDLSDEQKAVELAYQAPSWLLWQGLSEDGHEELAEEYEQSGYDTDAILPRIRAELGERWLAGWYDNYVPQLLQQDAADAPSFLFFDRPKVLRDAWLVHFTSDAEKVARQGFRHGIDNPMRVGLTTLLTQGEKTRPGYTFAFRPEDVNRYAWSRGRPKYGKEAVVFRANAVLAYHTSDEEDQAIAWGPEAKDRRAVRMDGRNPVVTDEDGEEIVYDDFPSLVADLKAGRI